jgi:predicted amidophosphoribosyltransferase
VRCGTVPGMTIALDTIARATWNTVSPVQCAGCGRPDVVCCPACVRELAPRVNHPTLAIRRALFDVPVRAGTHYQGVVRRVVTSYKERGVASLGRHLAVPLRAAVRAIHHETSLDGAIVVCVPHSRSGWVKRGRNPTRDLVKRAGWAGALAPASALRFSHQVPVVSDPSNQKTRSRRERLGAPQKFVGGIDMTGRRVLLVDDVLTTGISLEHAARVIESCGGVVVGAAVVAATPPMTQKISM